MRRELIVSFFLLAGVVSLYLSLSLMDDPRAVTFPRVIIIIMGILSGILLLQTLLVGKRGMGQKAGGFRFGPFSICFGLIIVYFGVMETLGFYVSAFLFFVAATFILGWGNVTWKKGAMRVFSSLIFTGVLYFLFNTLLAVQTPKGMLF
jgi:hypothetical protein